MMPLDVRRCELEAPSALGGGVTRVTGPASLLEVFYYFANIQIILSTVHCGHNLFSSVKNVYGLIIIQIFVIQNCIGIKLPNQTFYLASS